MTKDEKKQKRRDQREKAARFLGLYLDDLLLIAAGFCFISSAAVRFGCAAALATAGVCFAAYAVTVARAKSGK